MLRIALAQVNATVGDLDGNAELIVEWTRRAAARGARVVVFPEMMLTGYPVEDLALRASFVEASIARLHAVAARLGDEGLGGIAVVTGYLDRRTDLAPRTGVPAGAPLDAAALLHGGRVVITSAKHHLPNYGVFDEFRYFVPGNTLPVFRLATESGESVEIAIAICEDLWQDGGPVAVCARAGAGLLVVPNASPYERGKDDVRLDLVVRRAREANAALAYANMVGGQDELIFDGHSVVLDDEGEVLARAAEPLFKQAREGARGTGGQALLETLDRFNRSLADAPALRHFVEREHQAALRIITSSAGRVQPWIVGEITELIFSSRYAACAPAFAALMIGLHMVLVVNLMGCALISAGHPRHTLTVDVIRTGVVLFASLALAPPFGALGAAYARLLSSYSGAPAVVLLLRRDGPPARISVWFTSTAILLVCAVVAALTQPFGPLAKVGVGILFVVLSVRLGAVHLDDLRLLVPYSRTRPTASAAASLSEST